MKAALSLGTWKLDCHWEHESWSVTRNVKAGLSLGTWKLDCHWEHESWTVTRNGMQNMRAGSFFFLLCGPIVQVRAYWNNLLIFFIHFFIWTNSSGRSTKLYSTSVLLKCGSNWIHMYRNYATTSSTSTGTGGSTYCRTVATVLVHLDWSWVILHRVRPSVSVLMCPHTDVSTYLCVHVPIHIGLGTGTHPYRKTQAYYIYLYWSWTTWSCTWFSNTGVSNYTTVSTT